MKAKLNLFGNDKFEQLQRKNRQQFKNIRKEDGVVIERIERELKYNQVSKAYIEVIKEDMIRMAVSAKRRNSSFVGALEGGEKGFVEEVLKEAPKVTKIAKVWGILEDALYIFMVYAAVVVFLFNKPPNYDFGYVNIAVMAAALLALILTNIFLGKNSFFPQFKDVNDGIIRLVVMGVFLVISYFVETEMKAVFHVTSLIPLAIVILAWLLALSAGNICSNRDLKFIEKNYE